MTRALSINQHPAAKCAAYLVMFIVMTAVATNLRGGFQTDFVSFWAAGKLALAGTPAAAYDIELHRAVELSAIALDGLMPFPYPPPYLFVVIPVGLLPYAAAHAAWIGATLVLYAVSANRLVPGSMALALAFPPVVICGIIGQNSFLLAAIFLIGMHSMPSRPYVAGAVLGLLIFKPHLGVLLPIAFVAARDGRAFAGAAASTVGLALASLFAFGSACWVGFFNLLPLYGTIAAKGLVSWNKMASVYASLRLAGVPETAAGAIHIIVAASAIVLLWQVWRQSRDHQLRAAVLACATLLVSPYLYIYDQMLLIAPFAYLWARRCDAKWLLALYAVGLGSLAGNFHAATTINLAPLLPVMMLVLIRGTMNRAVVRPSGGRQAAFGADCLTPSST